MSERSYYPTRGNTYYCPECQDVTYWDEMRQGLCDRCYSDSFRPTDGVL